MKGEERKGKDREGRGKRGKRGKKGGGGEEEVAGSKIEQEAKVMKCTNACTCIHV